MTFRERTLAIYARKPVDNIVYQPRIEHWYNVNKRNGTLPGRYKDMCLLDVFKDLDCSIRTYPWFNPCLKRTLDPRIKIDSYEENGLHIQRVETPAGCVETHTARTELAYHTKKFPVENREDAKVMEYIIKGTTYSFDHELFKQNDELIGDLSAPMVFIPRVNIQRLFIEIMGFEATLYATYDDPGLVDRLVKAIDESDQQIVDLLCESPVPIINYGDNVDQHFLNPNIFEKYILPAYQDRSEKFRNAGKYTMAHWDGSVKRLLPYSRRTGLDSLEALTPIPQGDVTIEEIKEGLGDMILVDGIPMTCFLPHEPIEELVDYTHRIIRMFSPNLILGISDEPSPVCDIERVRLVAEILKDYEK